MIGNVDKMSLAVSLVGESLPECYDACCIKPIHHNDMFRQKV